MSEYNEIDENGKIICQICNIHSGCINTNHLKKHGLTLNEYKEMYPGINVVSQSFKEAKGRGRKKTEGDVKITEDIIMDEVPIKAQEIPEVKIEDLKTRIDRIRKISSEFEDVLKDDDLSSNPFYSTYPDLSNNIPKDKIKILSFIMSYFPDVVNSYFIEKISLGGSLEYKLITDIAIPSKKIDIEFPDAFWHNKDIQKHIRDNRLENDGWKIINIRGFKPSIDFVKNRLIAEKVI